MFASRAVGWQFAGIQGPMHKLPPMSLYQLRLLSADGPRFYKVTAYLRRLEVLQLINATGRTDMALGSIEYQITDAGRAELAERYGPAYPPPTAE